MLFWKKKDPPTLDETLRSGWKMLHSGVQHFRHPFHWPVLATVNNATPEARTVILRDFSEHDRMLICHCDRRSPKVSQICDNPHVSWLFYHPKRRIQLRLTGTATVHTEDVTADSQWEKVRMANRINYCTEKPPGLPAEEPTSGLPDLVRNKLPGITEGTEARKNFAAVVCRFDRMDWLLLKLTGNIRAKFVWEDNQLTASWVIP